MGKIFTITEGLENLGALKTGGQGSVYKAKRIGEMLTAVKLLPTPIHSETTEDKNFVAFQNEVQKLRKVNEEPNPHVVKFLGSGITESGSLPYIEMEFIEGPDLEDLLKPPHDPIFAIKEVLKVAFQLSHALEHCHKLDIRHGDIKSNNIKFNINSDNYILLDFGLAVMSDEQRRTSLRHAGAVEFMAPEQNEGQMLFQTDVYSFGVILFELLAGTVPFPLKDQGETARNVVRLAHLETPPPDLIALRQQALPLNWSNEKKVHEMQVPEWLVNMIYKCIEKKPERRFYNGVELHKYIVANSMIATNDSNHEKVLQRLMVLEQENDRLFRENERLKKLTAQANPEKLHKDKYLNNSHQQNQPPISYPAASPTEPPALASQSTPARKNRFALKYILLFLLIAGSIAALVYFLTNRGNEQPSMVRGEYKVVAERAYFHNEPDKTTRRNAFATPSNLVINSQQEKNGFIYTEITNDRGQKSKGWLRKEDLITLKDWTRISKPTQSREITAQLKEARQFLNSGNMQEALILYSLLAQREVPEAEYEYGNLALLGINKNMDCKQAFNLVLKAANKNYAPAKRTVGFLYSFANDTTALRTNNYFERCSFTENVSKGSKFLMEATLAGDAEATRLLEELNQKRQ